MRNVPSVLHKKLTSRIQAGATALNAGLWVGRPDTPLTEDRFLEKQTAVNSTGVTKTSIAVCRPHMMRDATKVSIAYIEDGVAKVVSSKYHLRMSKHLWEKAEFSQPAVDVAVCYDGVMKKTVRGTVELLTDADPWIFWVHEGSLYGSILGSGEAIALAENTCTAVSAIRAMWSYSGSFDFGLVVFFLLGGALFYRQLVEGDWKDAEPVTFGPPGVVWEDIAAFRTWDYRIGVQARATNGKVYELFTQYMGIAKQGEEHIHVDTEADVDLIGLTYHTQNPQEHLSIVDVDTGAPYGGFYEVRPPHFVSVENFPDESGDWGKLIRVVLSNHLRETGIANNAASFSLTDERGFSVSATGASLDVEDGLTVTLTFADFNYLYGVCKVSYTPGTATNMADTPLEYTELAFLPTNLVPPDIPAPEAVEIWNTDGSGSTIAIRFTEPLTGDPAGNTSAFTVSFQEYDMVPGGVLVDQSRTPLRVATQNEGDDCIVLLDMGVGNTTNIQGSVGEVTVSYAGGTLVGRGGMVPNFSMSFVPEGLVYKGHQHHIEHIELAAVDASFAPMRIYYKEPQGPEHIEASVSATISLIHIDDL